MAPGKSFLTHHCSLFSFFFGAFSVAQAVPRLLRRDPSGPWDATISDDAIEKAESITTRVEDKKGLAYETITAWTDVTQLDRYDEKNALVLRKGDAGGLTLESLPLP